MMPFAIHRIDRRRANQFEPLGSKPKFWFDDGRQLFKMESRGTGTDWAEVVAARLCQLIGLPHVDYHLAETLDDDGEVQRGVICGNIAGSDTSLVLGNQLLLASDPSYPSRQRWKVRSHTIDAVARVLQDVAPPPPVWTYGSPAGVTTASGFFVGYVLLDAWIANQDRHHENWAVLTLPGGPLALAPTFDHGAGMACILGDEERASRLSTRDQNASIDAFALRARSGFYGNETDRRTLHPLDVFRRFATYAPQSASLWLDRLGTVTAAHMRGIIDDVPEHLMSAVCREFTCQLLTINQKRLLASS